MSGTILLTAHGKKLATEASGSEVGERFLREIPYWLDIGGSSSAKMQRIREAGAFLASPLEAAAGALGRQLFVLEAMMMKCWRAAEYAADPALKAMHLNQAAKLHRSFLAAFDALDRHRGRGRQVMRVEHVHINAGAQAVVGIVGEGVGGKPEK
jgi:hypothetical protein